MNNQGKAMTHRAKNGKMVCSSCWGSCVSWTLVLGEVVAQRREFDAQSEQAVADLDVRLIHSLEAVHMVQALPGSGSHKHLTWSQRLRITAE